MELFGLWSELPVWLRYTVALVLMLIGGSVFFVDGISIGWPLTLFCTGLVLLCFAGPSDAEKKGYRF